MTTLSHPGGDVLTPDRPMPPPAAAEVAMRSRLISWDLVAFVGVVVVAAVLYVLNLTVSGYANTYYAAAAQAAAQSWSAWFFGSLDPANFITIDKPPLATMLMGLSVRVFGLSSWSILLPEALAGIATVGLLYATVRRTFGTAAAAIAGLVMALTPAAVLIFRFNNPDALMTLLLVGAAWAFMRALESDRLRWVALAAGLVGLAFNAKFLQAYLVLPAFALTYAIAAPGKVRRRILGLAVAAGALVVASGWWVLAAELIPASARPYIGGSQTNSALELLFGYDGLGRIFGQTGGGPAGGGGGPGGGGFSGVPGLLRLFNDQLGGQAAWLLPMAFVGLVAGLWSRRRAPRTDLARAGFLMWGGWLLVHAIVFSFMSGIIHSYYTVALAPAIGALVGGGAVALWRGRRSSIAAGAVLAVAIAGSGILAWVLLERTPTFVPGLGIAVAALSVATAVVVALPANLVAGRLQSTAAVVGLVALLAGPMAYAVDTMGTAYSGGDAAAGPAVAGVGFGGGGGGGGGQGLAGGFPNGGLAQVNGGVPGGGTGGNQDGGTGGNQDGGGTASSALTDYLVANQGSATWIVAVSAANEAGSIQLATGLPVMAMGGFTGSDPAPTLAQFQQYVASGQLRFVLVGGRGAGPGRGNSEIDNWVTANCTAVNISGSNGTLYDCATAVTGA